jgi:hypothetical protein
MNEPAVCENCGMTFTTRQTGQRFHSRECGLEYFQNEKREAVAWYRKYRRQLHQQEAQTEAAE